MKRTTIPVPSVCCDRCPGMLLESEATLSRRALAGAALCWRCRLHTRRFRSIHQAPAGCSLMMNGTGYGLWLATLTTPDGREFIGQAFTDHQAISCARAAARNAGVAL